MNEPSPAMDIQQSGRRNSIKSWHSRWKDKLRVNCLQRVEKTRSQLLWKIRLSGRALPISQDGAKIAFSDILVDEIDRIKQQKEGGGGSHARGDQDSMLWEYDRSDTFSELSPAEYEELMIAMQTILYEEMHMDNQNKETRLLDDFEKSCEQEDRALSTMLDQLTDEGGVVCPICKDGRLQQTQHLIYCSCGHLRLNVQHEKVNLDYLRHRLEELLQQHFESGCKCQPVFCMDTRFSIMALYMQCSSCEAFELVL